MTQARAANGPVGATIHVALTALLFIHAFNIEFIALPHLTGGRIALVILSLAYAPQIIAEAERTFARYGLIAWTLAGLALYSGVLSLFSGDWDQTSRLIHFGAYAIVGATVWVAVERVYVPSAPADGFLRRFAAVVALQSAFVFLSLLYSPFRLWVSSVLVRGGNMDLATALRPPGFSNSAGAAFSVVLALGIYAQLWTAQRAEGRVASTLWRLCAALTLLATAMSGRTGLIMLVPAPLFFLYFGPPAARRSLGVQLGVAALGVAVAWPLVVPRIRERVPDIDALATSAIEVFVKGSETASWRDIAQMPVPPLTDDTFAGTGRVVGPYGNASGNDSGYIQSYFALGAPMSLLFYVSVFALCLALVRDTAAGMRPLLVLLVLLMFGIERKEPFMFKYTLPMFVFTVALGAMPRRAITSPSDATAGRSGSLPIPTT